MKRAFIFTMDAFIVLPLVILMISAFVSFSVTLRENTLLHEYSYLIARNSMAYLSDLTVNDVYNETVGTGLAVPEEGTMSILELTAKHISSGDLNNANATIRRYLSVPDSAGFSFEWFDGVDWVPLYTKEKRSFRFQVSDMKAVTPIAHPYIQLDGTRVLTGGRLNYLQNYPCSMSIACAVPSTLYNSGRIYGAVALRLRIFM